MTLRGADYVFNRCGEPGIQREWWYHSASSTWFIAERDTASDEIVRTYLWGEEDPSVKAPPGRTVWRVDRPDAAALNFALKARHSAAFAGDVIASALLANGVQTMGRSFKYHRPRGAYSLARARCQRAVYRRRAHASARRLASRWLRVWSLRAVNTPSVG